MNAKELEQKILDAQTIVEEQRKIIVDLKTQVAKINIENDQDLIDKIIDIVKEERELSEEYTQNHQRITKEVNRRCVGYRGGNSAKEKFRAETLNARFKAWREESGYNIKAKELDRLKSEYAAKLTSDGYQELRRKLYG